MCLFQWPATDIVASGAGRHGYAPTNSDNLYGDDGGMCVCVGGGAGAHTCAGMRDVFEIYDNNI